MVKSVLIRTLANLLYISAHSQVIGHANVVVDDCVCYDRPGLPPEGAHWPNRPGLVRGLAQLAD
jgi:hypothetical protein